jgi:hypothetical protein
VFGAIDALRGLGLRRQCDGEDSEDGEDGESHAGNVRRRFPCRAV